jgi:hypothetical protein
MARKHFLINPHTSGSASTPSDLQFGEIAVRHNNSKPELLIKKDNGEFASFIDKVAINTIVTEINGEMDAMEESITGIKMKRKTPSTKKLKQL